MMTPNPFRYPTAIHVRKHGPEGYAKYAYFRPWLRDEFDFRCVYCLWREAWSHALSIFEIDHFVAVAVNQKLEKHYGNLVYACRNCNNRKSNRTILNPEKIPLGSCVEVLETGEIRPLNNDGICLIDDLGLDQKRSTDMRKLQIDSIRSHAKHDMPPVPSMDGLPR